MRAWRGTVTEIAAVVCAAALVAGLAGPCRAANAKDDVKIERVTLGNDVAASLAVPQLERGLPELRVPTAIDARSDPDLLRFERDGQLPAGWIYARRSAESLPELSRAIYADDLRQASTRALAAALGRAGVAVSAPSALPGLVLETALVELRIARFAGARQPWLRAGPLVLEVTLRERGEIVWSRRLEARADAEARSHATSRELLAALITNAVGALVADRSFFTALRRPALARAKHRIDLTDYAGARKLLAELLAADPELAAAHYLDGVALGLLGRLDESDAELARAARLGSRGDEW